MKEDSIRNRARRAVAAIAVLVSCTTLGVAQSSASAAGATASLPNAPAVQAGAISGSVPSGPATAQVLPLTLQEAIHLALKYNLGAVETSEDVRTARGERLLALSALLPHVNADLSEDVEQTDLASLGLKEPGLPKVIGPYSYSSADVGVIQSLFSFSSVQRLRAARNAQQAAQLNYQDTLDVITLAAGNAYLEAVADESRIEAQEAQVRNAQALYEQAENELQAGTAPRIDATRTDVQLHTEQYNLSIARNNFAIAKLTLARAIGLPLGQQFDLADKLPCSDLASVSLDDALDTANSSRSDLRAAVNAEKAADRALSAAKAERWPTAAVNGSYGDLGQTFDHSHGVFTFQAGIHIPIFNGGQVRGETTQAAALLEQRRAEVENLRGQIDYDVRTAFLNLTAAREQVTVARQNVALANDNLGRSKDRFASGVTDSVEVVQAEQALASADDQYITSLYSFNFAELSLARAMGVARTDYQQYLGGK